MKTIIAKFGQRKPILFLGILMVINLAMFYIPVMPGSIPNILKHTQNSSISAIPDLKIFLDLNEIYNFLSDITQEGRYAYQIMHLTTDLAFPIIYSLFFFSLTIRFIRGKESNKIAQKSLGFLPFLALVPAGFDLSENFMLLYITKNFPKYFGGLMSAIRIFTLGKFIFLLINLLLIAYLGIVNRINLGTRGNEI